MNNKGFIATSLIYSFFLIFVTLFLTIVADYLQDKVLLNTIEKGIKDDINNSVGIQDFEVGDILYFMNDLNWCGSGFSRCNLNTSTQYIIKEINYKIDGTGEDMLVIYDVENISTTITIHYKGRLKINRDNENYSNEYTIEGELEQWIKKVLY